MQTTFFIQWCLLMVAATMASEYRRTRNTDLEGFEFGRVAYLEDDGIVDNEVRFRELLEEDLAFLSMSMSMSLSMSFDYHLVTETPTPAPTPRTTPQPSPLPEASSDETPMPPAPVSSAPVSQPFIDSADIDAGVQCNGDSQTVSVQLEVETAIGKDSFSQDLKEALQNALGDEYTFCGLRRLTRRRLEGDVSIGGISVVEIVNESCIAQSEVANECSVAQADFEVYGAGDSDVEGDIETSLGAVFENDSEFDDALLLEGIVDVRLRDEVSESAVNAPLATDKDVSAGGRPRMAAILAVAAGTILIAAAIAKSRRGAKTGDKYDTDSDSQEDPTMVNISI